MVIVIEKGSHSDRLPDFPHEMGIEKEIVKGVQPRRQDFPRLIEMPKIGP
jgi:hypothetical protein